MLRKVAEPIDPEFCRCAKRNGWTEPLARRVGEVVARTINRQTHCGKLKEILSSFVRLCVARPN